MRLLLVPVRIGRRVPASKIYVYPSLVPVHCRPLALELVAAKRRKRGIFSPQKMKLEQIRTNSCGTLWNVQESGGM